MADPFDALRTPVSPVAPDPQFAQTLRTRLARALSLPKGVTVSDLQLDLDASRELGAESDLENEPGVSSAGLSHPTAVITRASITPYLAVSGAADALEWYAAALGARLRSEPVFMPDGRVGHAEIEIGGALVMLADEFPDIGHSSPSRERGVHVSLHLSVDNVDEVVDSAVALGAELERPPNDAEYGRNATIRDPFGHRWLIFADRVPDPPVDRDAVGVARHGDIGYVSLWVPDADRATSFFARVLGWEYAPVRERHARQVEGLGLHHGIWGRVARPTLFCCFAVADLDTAVERVRRAGGVAGEPQIEPYGSISECVDDQGVQFAIFEPPGGVRRSPSDDELGNATGGGQGELSYITMEVVDSGRTRAFYGSVLGWRFAPGRVDDGWQVEDVAPMVGVSGGHDQATTVPMYAVDNIDIAVEQVRAAGGTATSPEFQPYGTTSTCTDDQGTRFYLGQF
jgi:uncharacterized glyoxalase superfamily protein PhnB